jgi:hypothetical protein
VEGSQDNNATKRGIFRQCSFRSKRKKGEENLDLRLFEMQSALISHTSDHNMGWLGWVPGSG